MAEKHTTGEPAALATVVRVATPGETRGLERVVLILGLPALLLFLGVLLPMHIFSGGGEAGAPPVVDFAVFWMAGRMALAGDAPLSYDWTTFAAAQSATFTQDFAPGGLPWLNPPSFPLLLAPLATLSYPWAWLVWSVFSVALAVVAARAVLPRWSAGVAFLIAPGSIFSLLLGQNGLVTASLLGLALALMDKRPIAAGVFLGLLSYKPQFGLLFPILLAATGRWRVFFAAAATVITLVLVSGLAFGVGSWAAFLGAIGPIAGLMEAGAAVIVEFQSVRAILVGQGVPGSMASAAHAGIALASAALAVLLWKAAGPDRDEAAAAATLAALFLATPYSLPYDTTILALACVFLARAGLRDGALPGELAFGFGACLLTALPLWLDTHAAGAWAAAILLALAVRRGLAHRIPLAGNRI
ncbi:glycosyltransferase family 87 protein [Falsiroseomonas oryziterrae]|uniref:glycosyltransferase family 87 protein n=1 Tax=Falsiroseomonas oryziterrae TaxID=2911368 RepID=UPI001F16028F|nr:glycosyltransferase family 87 protein [Roseomonas sp. NPKOSM-4]